MTNIHSCCSSNNSLRKYYGKYAQQSSGLTVSISRLALEETTSQCDSVSNECLASIGSPPPLQANTSLVRLPASYVHPDFIIVKRRVHSGLSLEEILHKNEHDFKLDFCETILTGSGP